MDIRIQSLSPQDVHSFADLIRVFALVFEMEPRLLPDSTYLQSLLARPDFLVLVAEDGDKVVGGLTVYILHRYYSAKPAAYIYDAGVLPQYQRQGIGKRLISFLLAHCKEQGFEEAFVQAEAGDEQAINFYRSAGFGKERQATQFSCTFNDPRR